MNIRCSFRLCLCLSFVALVLLVSSVEGRKYKISKRLVCGASPDALLKSLLRISESACFDECGLRPSCKALDYSGRFKLCNLYSRQDIKLAKGHCNYMKRTDITFEIGCNTNCMDGEVCNVTSNECVISECKPMTSLVNGSFLGNLNNIGSTKREVCHNQFGNFTMPLAIKPPITCQADGTWNRQPTCVIPYNVALGKAASLSSVWYSPNIDASLMVNGDTSGKWVCACTIDEPEPWAMVDLGGNHQIFAFKIYNREDCCQTRLHDLEIYVGNSKDSLTLCNKHPGNLDPVMQLIVVKNVCFGRYVKLQIVDGLGQGHYWDEHDMLTICELQIYGHP